MKFFKAFDKGLVCRGKQYAENTVYEEKGADVCCLPGMMHFCERPLDVLNYYPLIDENGNIVELAEVEPLAKIVYKNDKCASRKIKIGAKLSLKDFIKNAVDIDLAKTLAASGDSSKLAASGDDSRLAASGDDSRLAASGNWSRLTTSGDDSQLAASGDSSKLAASGNWNQLAASGNWSRLATSGDSSELVTSGNWSRLAASGNWNQLAASGDDSRLATSGNWSRLATSGNWSRLATSGDDSQLAASGENSVIMSCGRNSKAKGKKGCWIVLTELEQLDGTVVPFVKAEKIDGKKIKEDTWYALQNHEFIEIEEN